MTPTPQELDRLEQQAKVLLEWTEAKKNGLPVTVEYQEGEAWYRVDNPTWSFRNTTYRLSCPSTPKERVLVRDELLLGRDMSDGPWMKFRFHHFHEQEIYGRFSCSDTTLYNFKFWKFPDEPEQVKEVKTFKEVELGPEDFKGLWWVKNPKHNVEYMQMVLCVYKLELSTKINCFTYKRLMKDGWLRSRDGVEWTKCSKAAQGEKSN